MSQSVKSICVVVILVGLVVAAVAWTESKPDTSTWTCRIGGVATMLLAGGVILWLQFRPDLARDYLRRINSRYFNRGGFCFAFVAEAIEGVAYLTAYFQNQYSRPCIGRIALRPARGFFMNRAAIKAITFSIQCEAAAYGMARITLPLSKELQGTSQPFDVGASVFYLKGKGRRLRFRDGLFLRTNADFGNSFATALMVAGAATGHIVWNKPAKVKIQLPQGVAEHLSGEPRIQVRTLWKLKDPPL